MFSRSLSVSYEDFHVAKQFALESKKHDLIVCIPAYAETSIEETIYSIIEGDSYSVDVGIVVLINDGINAPVTDKQINQVSFEKIRKAFRVNNTSNFTLHA